MIQLLYNYDTFDILKTDLIVTERPSVIETILTTYHELDKDQIEKNNMVEIFEFIFSNMSVENIIKCISRIVEFLIFDSLIQIIKNMDNVLKMNDLLSKMVMGSQINKKYYCQIIRSINPMLLSQENAEYAMIDNYNLAYDQFVAQIDNTVPLLVNNTKSKKAKICQEYDNRMIPQILFHYNDEIYYGNRNIIYPMIDFFKDNDFVKNGNAKLFGNLDHHYINLYLNQTLNQSIDLDSIDTNVIFDFINWIDQYPTDTLSLNKLEIELIDYFNKNSLWNLVENNQKFQNIMKKYNYKSMYFHMYTRNHPH